ncbi:MAG: hypothetical protein H7242_00725 [Microbacteriaceae bacterium]|nr:hypothetical protein [Burkholderiaceae bacterium]
MADIGGTNARFGWVAGPGAPVSHVRKLPVAAHAGPVYSVAFNAAGNTIVSGGADKTVKVWNANGSLSKALDGHPGLVFSVSFDAERQRVLAAGKDLQATGWKLADEAIVPAGGKTRAP